MLPNDPERALTIAYAARPLRPALALLWRLDERLGGIVATTRDEHVGMIRLAWWREALERLDGAAPPDEPLLHEAAALLLPRGLPGAELGRVADGWGALLQPMPLTEEDLAEHAAERGEWLFTLAGRLLDEAEMPGLAEAGQGWALIDLAAHISDTATAERARAMARVRLDPLLGRRWPARLRALGALAVLAAGDARAEPGTARTPGSPARVFRALRHRLTGR